MQHLNFAFIGMLYKSDGSMCTVHALHVQIVSIQCSQIHLGRTSTPQVELPCTVIMKSEWTPDVPSGTLSLAGMDSCWCCCFLKQGTYRGAEEAAHPVVTSMGTQLHGT